MSSPTKIKTVVLWDGMYRGVLRSVNAPMGFGNPTHKPLYSWQPAGEDINSVNRKYHSLKYYLDKASVGEFSFIPLIAMLVLSCRREGLRLGTFSSYYNMIHADGTHIRLDKNVVDHVLLVYQQCCKMEYGYETGTLHLKNEITDHIKVTRPERKERNLMDEPKKVAKVEKINMLHVVFRCAGVHQYPGCKKEYLAHQHRHDFKINVAFGVTELNRELEFFDLEKEIHNVVQCLYPVLRESEPTEVFNFNDNSCEHIANNVLDQLLLRGYKIISVSVFEDDNNGSTVIVREKQATQEQPQAQDNDPLPLGGFKMTMSIAENRLYENISSLITKNNGFTLPKLLLVAEKDDGRSYVTLGEIRTVRNVAGTHENVVMFTGVIK